MTGFGGRDHKTDVRRVRIVDLISNQGVSKPNVVGTFERQTFACFVRRRDIEA
jgi:hypothetical protein